MEVRKEEPKQKKIMGMFSWFTDDQAMVTVASTV